MSAFRNSFVCSVLLGKHEPSYGINPGRWRWLTRSLFDPYRPELHYMRGPGPKWREKYGLAAGASPLGGGDALRSRAKSSQAPSVRAIKLQLLNSRSVDLGPNVRHRRDSEITRRSN